MTDIGATLREARMRERLDIAEFESRTKIRAKYLRALEDEEWSLLPGYTFTKAFLRTYADMLGLDGRTLVDEFKRQYQDPSEIELAPVLPSRRDGRRARERSAERSGGGARNRRSKGPSSRVLLVAVLVVALAAALFAVQELRKHHNQHTTTTSTTTSHTTTTHTTHTHRVVRRRVALQIIPSSAVRVCLVGYRSAGGPGLQRVNRVLAPSLSGTTYHADNHFTVSFTDGSARMLIDARNVTVSAPGTTLAYEIFLSGHHLQLPAAKAPQCS